MTCDHVWISFLHPFVLINNKSFVQARICPYCLRREEKQATLQDWRKYKEVLEK
jgi:hypothetical protein